MQDQDLQKQVTSGITDNLSTVPTVTLITGLSDLEQELGTKVIIYNKMIKEVIKRFPNLNNKDEFQEKELVNVKRKIKKRDTI